MKELGEYLKDTREENHVSINEVAEDLNMSVNIIENIEIGNTRAFRDMYDLKDKIKEYAKYLGLDPEKIIDEFNDFFFEHTSKISLDDILQAENMSKQNAEKKVESPYTKPKKIKIDARYYKPILLIALVVMIIFATMILIVSILIPKNRVITKELLVRYDEVIRWMYQISWQSQDY